MSGELVQQISLAEGHPAERGIVSLWVCRHRLTPVHVDHRLLYFEANGDDTRLRADARGRDGGVRQELAAGIMDCFR